MNKRQHNRLAAFETVHEICMQQESSRINIAVLNEGVSALDEIIQSIRGEGETQQFK